MTENFKTNFSVKEKELDKKNDEIDSLMEEIRQLKLNGAEFRGSMD